MRQLNEIRRPEEFELEFKATKGMASLFSDGVDDYWLPLSQIYYDEDATPGIGEVINVVIPEWLAKDKGLI